METQAGYIVVFFLLKKLLVECNTRGHKFRHASLDDILCEFRVFKLVTDSNFIA